MIIIPLALGFIVPFPGYKLEAALAVGLGLLSLP